MCQNSDCGCDNPRILIEEEVSVPKLVSIQATPPIYVSRNDLPDETKYTISTTIPQGNNGADGRDGKDGENGTNGKDGITPSITIGSVTQGTNAQVTNTGTPQSAIFNFVIPKGEKGDATNGKDGKNGKDGVDGVALGLKSYAIGVGNTGGQYLVMGNFTQGTFADTGNTDLKRIRIRAWVTVANMQNWTTLRLIRSTSPGYQGTLISQRVKHSEATLYVGQHEISAYVETSDRYIGFTFSDTPGGNYNSDGEQYGDYGVEIFILS